MFVVISGGPAGPIVEDIRLAWPSEKQMAEYTGYDGDPEQMVADADSIGRDSQGRIEDITYADGDVWYAVRRSVR